MLQTIRDRAQGWIAYIIIGLIIIPFALWGIQEYVGGGGEIEVASIEDTTISQREFQQAYEQQRERIRAMLGANADALDEAKIKRNVLDSMVRNEVVRQATQDFGLRVSDTQLAEQIHSMPEFQSAGQFSKETFTDLLRRQGIAPGRFEAAVKGSLLSDQLSAAITSTAIVTQYEVDEAIRVKNQQREIGYLILPWENFKKDVTVSDKAVAQYYEKNRERYVTPEQVNVEYLELAAADLAKQVKVDEQELRKMYEEQRASFAIDEQRRASHILIALANEADEAAIAAAKTKAEQALKRAKAGEPFDKLAQELSQDPSSAKQGGDLGLFTKGTMDKAFEEAVFALKPGELSGVVKSAFGFHVIKLTEIKPAHVKPFEEVRAELEKEYQQRKAQALYFEKAELFANLVYENPDTLEIAAKELGLQVKTSGFFSRDGGEGITAQPKVIRVAFSDEVVTQGYNSEPIEIAEHHVVVLRLKEHKKPSARRLEEVKQEITDLLRTQAAQEKAQAVGEAIQQRLSQGADPQALAKEYQVNWVKPGFVTREADSLGDPAIVEAAFELAKPTKDKPVVSGTRLESGDYAVLTVYAVKEGSPAALESAARLALRRELQRARADNEYQNFVDELKREAKVVIHQDKL